MKRPLPFVLAALLLALVGWLLFSHSSSDNRAAKSFPATKLETRNSLSPPRNSKLETRNSAPSSPQPAEIHKRPWDPKFLSSLSSKAVGDPIQFELLPPQQASGTILHTERAEGEAIYISGTLTQPEPGRFFFQKQTRPGVAGDFVGVVEFFGSQKAYRIEPSGAAGAAELVERPLDKVICLNLPPAPDEPAPDPQDIPPLGPEDFPNVPIPGYQNGIIVLESLPGSTPVIYMDYQGGYTPTWGGITYAKPVADNTQIRDVWQRVAEDYMPFNINVTTDLKVFQNAPQGSRQRVIVTPTTTAAPGKGGVSYVGSFNWTGDTPCWAFYATGKNAAEAIAHEAGHGLGLNHDGKTDGTNYFSGQGSGETGWAPIMGVGYYQNVSEWSKGEYTNANNTEDDLNIISTRNNNVSYRPDDTGDTLATSRYLEIYSNSFAKAEGVIERTGDTDAFQFTTSGGAIALRADPVANGPNLAISATLCDANDFLLASNNPQATLWASISTNLPAGTYTFRVTGAGRNDPLTTGFSPYASLGYYTVTGTVQNARVPTRFAIAENSTNGCWIGVVPANNPNGDPLAYAITAGNTSNTFSLDNSGNLFVANNALLDYEALAPKTQLPVQFEMFVDIVDTLDSSFTETHRRLLVAVTNLNEAPVANGFAASVLEHTLANTALGSVTASDPDFYTVLSYSIAAGNNNGMFKIDTNSGSVSVAGDLDASVQSAYNLTVVISDQTPPTPLTATTTVAITVLPNYTPFRPGTISYAVYTNISGQYVSNLLRSPSFPLDPAFEKQLTSFEGDTNRGDAYGAALRGFLIPPATGTYTFWIASDDNSELLLSSSTNTAGTNRIAYISGISAATNPRQWTKYASQQSSGISLVAGQAYYIEARLKESSANDHISVAWQCASAGITRDVIPGRFLAPFFLNYAPRVLGFACDLHRDAMANSRFGPAGVFDANPNDGHTFSLLDGSSGLFSIDPVSGYIRVTNEAQLLSASQTNYTLQVRATDTGSPPRSGTNTITILLWPANAITTTSLRQEIWTNIGAGTAVSNLTSLAKYPKRPDLLRLLTNFDSGQNFGDACGSRIRATLLPTNSGAYNFFVSSSDNSMLLFSTNLALAPATTIATLGSYADYQVWDQVSSQRSAAISLNARQPYYLETLHKAGPVSGHVEVGWTGPGSTNTNVIAGTFLQPVNLNYPPELSNASAVVTINASNGSPVATMTGLDSPLDTLTYKILSGNSNNTFAIDSDSGQITIADNTLIATYLASSFNLRIQVQDSGYGGLYPLQSTQANLAILVSDNTAPYIWNGADTNNYWSSASNWKGALPADNGKLVFAGQARCANINDLLTQVGPVAFSNGGFAVTGNPLKLLAGLSSIGDNTWAIESTLNKPQTFTNLSGTLTLSSNINNNGFLLTLLASNTIRVDGQIIGSGGLLKTGPGKLILANRNTFSGPTILAQGTLALSSAGSLEGTQSIELQSGTTLDAQDLPTGLTIASFQALSGGGSLLGDLSVNGLLSPGISAGILTIGGNLSLNGNTLIELSKSGGSITNDSIQVGQTLSCGGTLTLTNTADALGSGDTFKIFYAAQFTNAFATFILPPLPSDLYWDISGLQIDGAIRVAPLFQPQLLPVAAANMTLQLQIQSALQHNYILEATADFLPPITWTSLATNAGTGGLLEIKTPVESSGTNRFYRLRVE